MCCGHPVLTSYYQWFHHTLKANKESDLGCEKAERRAQSAESRAQSAERRVQSAEHTAQSFALMVVGPVPELVRECGLAKLLPKPEPRRCCFGCLIVGDVCSSRGGFWAEFQSGPTSDS